MEDASADAPHSATEAPSPTLAAMATALTVASLARYCTSSEAPVHGLPTRSVDDPGATDTLRHLLAANGSNVMTGTLAGTFGTVPATITPPVTFTTAVGPIAQLYV